MIVIFIKEQQQERTYSVSSYVIGLIPNHVRFLYVSQVDLFWWMTCHISGNDTVFPHD